MEKVDDVQGTGNALDFGARIFDSRLGRWMSMDPLQAKYPNLSPYHSFKNSPLLYIDNDGRDNIVYLVVLSDGASKLSKEDMKNIQLKANSILGYLGVSTRVQLFDGTNFNPKYLDKNDSYILLGSKTEISDFVSNPQDKSKPKSGDFSDLHFAIQDKDFLESAAPEASVVGRPNAKNYRGELIEGRVGQGIAISIDQAIKASKTLKSEGELPFIIGFIAVHAITHNAGVKTSTGLHIGNQENISMNSSGAVMAAYVNGDTGEDYIGDIVNERGTVPHPVQDFITSKSEAQKETIKTIKGTFGQSKATDNYGKNKSK